MDKDIRYYWNLFTLIYTTNIYPHTSIFPNLSMGVCMGLYERYTCLYGGVDAHCLAWNGRSTGTFAKLIRCDCSKEWFSEKCGKSSVVGKTATVRPPFLENICSKKSIDLQHSWASLTYKIRILPVQMNTERIRKIFQSCTFSFSFCV